MRDRDRDRERESILDAAFMYTYIHAWMHAYISLVCMCGVIDARLTCAAKGTGTPNR
jgi:hypothetical protein